MPLLETANLRRRAACALIALTAVACFTFAYTGTASARAFDNLDLIAGPGCSQSLASFAISESFAANWQQGSEDGWQDDNCSGQYQFAPTVDLPSDYVGPASTATWSFNVPSGYSCDLSVWIPATPNTNAATMHPASYLITGSGFDANVSVDQYSIGHAWASLGTYTVNTDGYYWAPIQIISGPSGLEGYSFAADALRAHCIKIPSKSPFNPS